MMNNEQHKRIRNALMMAALDCGHTIDSDGVTLQCDPAKPGNSLAQLSDRLLEAYLAAASAAVGPVQAPQAMVPLSADGKSVWIDGVGDVRLAQAPVPVAALMYMDELPAAQAGEKWIHQFASQADKALYAPDEACQAVRIKWCAYFDSYDRLVAAYLLTRDSKNWTQLTKVRGEAFDAPVQPAAAPDDLRNTLELAYIALDTPHSLHVVRLKAMKGIRKMLDEPCTAAADRGALQANGQHPAPCARDCEAPAFKNQLRERDALIARLKARLARCHAPPSPETQQAIAAARAAGQSVAATPGGLVFMNDGAEPGNGELDCPACGGSGHAGDVATGGAP
ncbi:hypothetical protein [Janthinobacterium sp. J1-1]|uniref:hypothetical protein n=1 Tax=Janthinobacterium sp. J1-1 TaxID=3065910 RepID=UPI0028115FC4|nr:hypothetical protein [Janthinobacterium sp. J1-1]